MTSRGDITEMLRRWQDGDPEALDKVLPSVYRDLRAMAATKLSRQSGHATLQPTALLNEMFLRLIDAKNLRINDREHLFRLAARTMRQILVDRARRSSRDKHGGDLEKGSLTEALNLPLPEGADIEQVDAALEELERLDKRLSRIVELRYFVGLSVPEVAKVLGVDERTVYRDWSLARSWLRERLDSV